MPDSDKLGEQRKENLHELTKCFIGLPDARFRQAGLPKKKKENLHELTKCSVPLPS
jgi:hypothetical protein